VAGRQGELASLFFGSSAGLLQTREAINMAQDTYDLNQVIDLREMLTALAAEPRTSFTKKDVVADLLDEITAALSSHSYETVADKMRTWGLDITAGSLKQHVTRLSRERKKKPSTKRGAGEKKAIALQPQATPESATCREHNITSTSIHYRYVFDLWAIVQTP
jgi:hypothetical protein